MKTSVYLYETKIFSYKEIEAMYKEEQKYMTLEEKNIRAREADPTFFEYLLYHMKEHQHVQLEYNIETGEMTTSYTII